MCLRFVLTETTFFVFDWLYLLDGKRLWIFLFFPQKNILEISKFVHSTYFFVYFHIISKLSQCFIQSEGKIDTKWQILIFVNLLHTYVLIFAMIMSYVNTNVNSK